MNIKWKWLLIGGVLVSLFLAIVVSPYADENPDGLERIAEDKGFAEAASEEPVWANAPMPDYAHPSFGGSSGTKLAGLFGTLAALLAGLFIGTLLKGKKKTT